MTETIKDSGDDVQVLPSPQLGASSSLILAPPPPYSIDIDQEASNTNESREVYSANPQSVAISHPSALTIGSQINNNSWVRTYSSRLSSKRAIRTLAIFIICMFVLTIHLHDRSVKDKRHQLIRDGLAWANVTPSNRCLRFGTREYSAQLMGVPRGEGGLRWCKEKAVIIHDTNIEKPVYCTVDNSAPADLRIFGYWTVDFNEPSGKTLWENFQDKGCVAIGSKTRRIEAHMGNHQPPWDNWREMCSTTPADYDGHHFDQPSSCDHRGIFSGVWGVWFVKDESC
ncbi:hypothetical protein EDD85DRAFT_957884 [Armillaria nabsnona]|nr:hypothetical protein EDD85DRAFT_957884 [Armillaria nabsnona]